MSRKLLAEHQAFIAHIRKRGRRIVTFPTPCCEKPLDTQAPENDRETWDTLTICPHCGSLFLKVVKKASAHGFMRPKAED